MAIYSQLKKVAAVAVLTDADTTRMCSETRAKPHARVPGPLLLTAQVQLVEGWGFRPRSSCTLIVRWSCTTCTPTEPYQQCVEVLGAQRLQGPAHPADRVRLVRGMLLCYISGGGGALVTLWGH